MRRLVDDGERLHLHKHVRLEQVVDADERHRRQPLRNFEFLGDEHEMLD